MTGVSAVIVHYRGESVLDACVASCLAEGVDEVLVVDNSNSAPRSADRRVEVLRMPRNVGYGRAANIGLRHASADAVLVLNQDVVLESGSVRAILEGGATADAWLAGPRLVDGQGRSAAVKTGFPWPLRWRPPAETPRGVVFVPWLAGAVIMFLPGHTDLRFDERFFMYVEDEDLCARVWRDGGRVALVPGAAAVHLSGTATVQRWSSSTVAWRIVTGRARMVRSHRGAFAAGAFLVRRAGQVVSRPWRDRARR